MIQMYRKYIYKRLTIYVNLDKIRVLIRTVVAEDTKILLLLFINNVLIRQFRL